MSNKKPTKQLSTRKIIILFRLFFRKHPAIPYLFRWLFISSAIGTCIGLASAGFLLTLDFVTHFREAHLWIIALLPVGGFIIGLLYQYFGKSVEGGNNLLIDTIHQPQATIPFRMAPFVYIGTIVTHLLGGSAGREGTALQMAGAIADQFSKPFRLSATDRKVLIIAAVAAGFGSVFGTPLAGAVFGLEFFLVGRLRYNAILPAFLAATIADLVTKLCQVQHTVYHIAVVPELSAVNLLYAIIAGIAFGLCAATFSKIINYIGGLFKTYVSYAPLRPVIGGIIVAAAVWGIQTSKYIGLGIPTIVQAFNEPLPPYDFVLKMSFTIITLAAGFKGGEVTPLFFIGATLGNALAYFIPLPLGLLTGMGFVAVFAGATNTPLACMLMGIELFGQECGIYVALACVVAYLLSGHTTIYQKQVIGEPKHSRFSNDEGKRMNELKTNQKNNISGKWL